MAEMVTVDGQQVKKRNPLGVLGLDLITIGIYFFVWYYKINDELRRVEKDDTISPMRSLMAMIFGWLIIVPPFLAMWNTAKHVRALEQRKGLQQTLEPALTIVILLIFAPANTTYVQSHLNSAWDAAVSPAVPAVPPPPATTPPATPT
jgi:ACR3 family arsenite efflux pump ArsB